MQGVFAVDQNACAGLPGADILLVDDVLTTGTTARRCAEALRAGGAGNITVLAFTRAVGGSSGLYRPH
jgi:predicted amidophosphoribosyltransferase